MLDPGPSLGLEWRERIPELQHAPILHRRSRRRRAGLHAGPSRASSAEAMASAFASSAAKRWESETMSPAISDRTSKVSSANVVRWRFTMRRAW